MKKTQGSVASEVNSTSSTWTLQKNDVKSTLIQHHSQTEALSDDNTVYINVNQT